MSCVSHRHHYIRLFLEDRVDVLCRNSRHKVAFKVELLGLENRGAVQSRHIGEIKFRDNPNDNESFSKVERRRVTFAVTPASQQLPRVKAVCMCLAESHSIQFWMSSGGFLLYEKKPAPTMLQSRISNENLISLEYLIDRASCPTNAEAKWDFQHRITLAFRLSCTVLQLNRTHWLESSCSSSTIFFRRISGSVGSTGQLPFEADHPFVTRSDPPGFLEGQPSPWARHVVLDLGIVLMELWKLQTFMTWSMQRQRPLGESFDERFSSAKLWLAEIEPTVLPCYKQAVRRCIELASCSYSFDDDDFRQSLCEGLIKPLWELCKPWIVQR